MGPDHQVPSVPRKKPSTIALQRRLKCLCTLPAPLLPAPQYERALSALEDAKALGVPLDTRTYNIALRACHSPGKTLRQEQLMQVRALRGPGGQWARSCLEYLAWLFSSPQACMGRTLVPWQASPISGAQRSQVLTSPFCGCRPPPPGLCPVRRAEELGPVARHVHLWHPLLAVRRRAPGPRRAAGGQEAAGHIGIGHLVLSVPASLPCERVAQSWVRCALPVGAVCCGCCLSTAGG